MTKLILAIGQVPLPGIKVHLLPIHYLPLTQSMLALAHESRSTHRPHESAPSKPGELPLRHWLTILT